MTIDWMQEAEYLEMPRLEMPRSEPSSSWANQLHWAWSDSVHPSSYANRPSLLVKSGSFFNHCDTLLAPKLFVTKLTFPTDSLAQHALAMRKMGVRWPVSAQQTHK